MSRPSSWIRLPARRLTDPGIGERRARRVALRLLTFTLISPLRLGTYVWAIRVMTACLALVGASGCATVDVSSRSGGSGLTAAAEEAKKGEDDKHVNLHAARREPSGGTCESEIVIASDDGDEYRDDDDDEYRDDETDSTPAPTPKTPRPPFHVGLIAGAGSASGGQFQQHGLAGIQVGVEPAPRTRVDLALMAMPQRFTGTHGSLRGLNHPFEVAADLSARYYLTPDDAMQSVYPIAGIRLGALLWDYHHSILIDGAPVTEDALDYFSTYVGIGASLLRAGGFELGANLTGGWRIYDQYTDSGLRNDLFRDAEFVQVMFETTYRF